MGPPLAFDHLRIGRADADAGPLVGFYFAAGAGVAASALAW